LQQPVQSVDYYAHLQFVRYLLVVTTYVLRTSSSCLSSLIFVTAHSSRCLFLAVPFPLPSFPLCLSYFFVASFIYCFVFFSFLSPFHPAHFFRFFSTFSFDTLFPPPLTAFFLFIFFFLLAFFYFSICFSSSHVSIPYLIFCFVYFHFQISFLDKFLFFFIFISSNFLVFLFLAIYYLHFSYNAYH